MGCTGTPTTTRSPVPVDQKVKNRGVEYLLSSTEGPGPGLACASLMLDDDSRLSASCSLSNQDNRILGQKADRISSEGHNRL